MGVIGYVVKLSTFYPLSVRSSPAQRASLAPSLARRAWGPIAFSGGSHTRLTSYLVVHIPVNNILVGGA